MPTCHPGVWGGRRRGSGGDEVGLALDCGPGWMVPDALKLARALEPLNVMWLEDMITGDYTPYVLADLYKQVTPYTTTPIHTGEQIYLRHNFKELIETRVRPAVANDGGDIRYRGFRSGVVYLQMQGACSGCPSSAATLKQGIEGLLKHYIPEVTEVRAA